MPFNIRNKESISLKFIFQLIAGLLFLAIGVYIILSNFENNYVLVGSTKYMFGGILCLYGIVRIGRIYFNLKTRKEDYYENNED